MKNLVILLTVFLSMTLSAQETTTKKLFLRVYDIEGKKIAKGIVFAVDDTLLVLRQRDVFHRLSFADIGKIKTKRSAGHNMLIGVSGGVLAGAILGSSSPPSEDSPGLFTYAGGSKGEEFAAGLTVGILSGTIVGGVSALFKNPQTFFIDGDPQQWKKFKYAVLPFAENRID